MDVDVSRLLASIVVARARVLAPAVFAALVFFVAAATPLGIRADATCMAIDWGMCAASALLAVALVARRVPMRWIHVASAACLWAPMIAALVPLYATGNPTYALFLIVELACAGVLLDTLWTLATIASGCVLAILPLVVHETPATRLDVSLLVVAGLFASLIHALMQRALLREARAARDLARSLSEQQQLHEQLLHAQRMDAIGTLAAGVAHDMNNVLASIANFAALVAEDLPQPQPGLDQIVAHAERGAALTRDLLAVSRRRHRDERVVRLDDLVRGVSSLLERTLPKPIAVHHEVGLDDVRVEADPAHLTQAIVNLALNAADAMNGAGTLTIAGDVHDGRARLRVRDTGRGMDEATRRRVFEPFFTTKPAGQGTGLGLSIVWGIVQAHRGTIEVESQPGNGATFTITLPTTTRAAAPQPKRAGTGPIAGHRRVLVVDDEPGIRDSAQRLLARLGLLVETAADGVAALAVFESRGSELDAIVLDLAMPGMSGAECFRRIRERSDVPVLITTGCADDHVLGELASAGAQLLEKPYAPDELRAIVARMIDGAAPPRSRERAAP